MYDYVSASEEDDEDSDEDDTLDHSWYSTEDDQIFFSLTTESLEYNAGEQILIQYGNRSNRYLLLWYGF